MNTKNGFIAIPFILSATPLFPANDAPKNIVFILADDYGWNDVACMGSKFYETPNIDRLSRNGITFTNAYAACQVSSPSRASIMTGKYPVNHGITNWIGEKSGESWRSMNRNSKMLPADYIRGIDANELLLPEKLKEHNYKTFIAGKWHLGEEELFWPEQNGFDINKGGWAAGSPKGGYFSPYKNPKLPDGKPGENLSLRLANETVEFIDTHLKENNKQPFFAYLSFYAVHGPIETNQQNWEHFRNKADSMGILESGFKIDRTLPVRQTQDNPIYAGLIKQMDDAVGVVLDALNSMGISENTLVVFTSDNGGVTSGDAYSTSLLPLRGGKGRQWEGGIRVPLFIQYGKNYQGTSCDVSVIGTDFYPTILEYAGLPLVPQQHRDGLSILPLLQGKEIASRCLFWHYPHYGNQGGEPSSIVRSGDWKLIYYHEDNHFELYNLQTDIGENIPLNNQFPEKEEELKKILLNWLAETEAKMPIADEEYNYLKDLKNREDIATKLIKQKEKERKKILDINFSPNKDWWGSSITID